MLNHPLPSIGLPALLLIFVTALILFTMNRSRSQ